MNRAYALVATPLALVLLVAGATVAARRGDGSRDAGGVAGPDPSKGQDGRPGWGGGFSGCTQPQTWVEGPVPAPGLDVEFQPTATRVRPGGHVTGWLVMRNSGTHLAEFHRTGADGNLLDAERRPRSLQMFSDAHAEDAYRIPPGETRRVQVRVHAAICGDGPGDDPVPLPAGTYSVVARVGGWAAPGVEVTLDPSAPEGATWEEPPRVAYRGGSSCSSRVERTAVREGLALAVETEGTTVRSGGTFRVTVVVRATGATVPLHLHRTYAPVVLRGGARQVTGLTPGAREDREIVEVRPGDTYRFRYEVRAVGCRGVPLAPGTYSLVAGIGVQDGGPAALNAPTTPFTVVP